MTSSPFQVPWLPLAKAAENISRSTRRYHSEGDVLSAALEGYFTLSVQIKSNYPVKAGQFQERNKEAPFGISSKKLLYAGVGFWGCDGDPFAYTSNKVERVQGVLDMILIGVGKTHIENIMHGILDNDDDEPLGGIYLQDPTGTTWEVQNEIVSGECEYAPAERFPGDWRIVVRTSELDRFIEECQQDAQKVSGDSITVAALSLISGKFPEELLKDAVAFSERERVMNNRPPTSTIPLAQPTADHTQPVKEHSVYQPEESKEEMVTRLRAEGKSEVEQTTELLTNFPLLTCNQICYAVDPAHAKSVENTARRNKGRELATSAGFFRDEKGRAPWKKK